MSYINALIKNLPESNDKYDTSDTDSEVDIEVKTTRNNFNKNEKFESLLEAQSQLISKCLPSNRIDSVIKNSLDNKNWRGIRLSLNIDQDNIFIERNNKKYTFSKRKFLENKVFKYNLIKSFTNKYGNNIWIKVYKDNEKFKIFVCRNKNIK